jgi:hypothetical protein
MSQTHKTKLSSPFVNITPFNHWLTWVYHGCLFDCNKNNTRMAMAKTKKHTFCNWLVNFTILIVFPEEEIVKCLIVWFSPPPGYFHLESAIFRSGNKCRKQNESCNIYYQCLVFILDGHTIPGNNLMCNLLSEMQHEYNWFRVETTNAYYTISL